MKNINHLKERLKPKFDKIYDLGGRGIVVGKTYIEGYVIEPDLSSYPNRKISTTIKLKHNINLKDYGIDLKKDEKISVGGSHIYIYNTKTGNIKNLGDN
ncbi:MAG: hypothetical protein ACOCP8_09130 [archaeon]